MRMTSSSPARRRLLLQYEVQPLVEQFLKERGLELSHEKTSITHIEDGFDFLGQTIRRHRNGKILIKPSKRSVKTFLSKIQETIDSSGSLTVGDMIRRLNQQIKGWTMYHRFAVSSRIFAAVDDRIFWKLRRWCRKRHRAEELGVDQEEILPTSGRPRLGVHRRDPRQRRQGLADPADESRRGQGTPVAEDSERSQPVRSVVGTVLGGADGLEDGPHSCGTGPDRLYMERTGQ